jgi:hypothetical protein
MWLSPKGRAAVAREARRLIKEDVKNVHANKFLGNGGNDAEVEDCGIIHGYGIPFDLHDSFGAEEV